MLWRAENQIYEFMARASGCESSAEVDDDQKLDGNYDLNCHQGRVKIKWLKEWTW